VIQGPEDKVEGRSPPRWRMSRINDAEGSPPSSEWAFQALLVQLEAVILAFTPNHTGQQG
ncbi:hypothetical protein H112_00718, partial [Trichophyton rubrum D6]